MAGTEKTPDTNEENNEVVVEKLLSDGSPDPFSRLKKKQVAVPQQMKKIQGRVKQGKKISPRVFLIGCISTFLLFLGLVFLGLYYAINSSDFLQGIGLKVEDVKSILLIFAAMFFGLIFFLGFYILVLNIYRLVTVKTKSKVKYVLGLLLGFFLILSTIVVGTLSIQRIRSLGGQQKIQTNLLLIPHIETRDGIIDASNGIPLIGPVKIRYQINKAQFDRNVFPSIGRSNEITAFSVDCGNGQTLSANQSIYQGTNGGFFADHCLYTDKGNYDLLLNVDYVNAQSGEAESKSFAVTTFAVNAAVSIVPEEKESYLNDKGNEMIIGVAPISASFKAQLLFSDLGLKNDRIFWDMNNDGEADLTNNANFIYPFGSSRLHTITYNLPELQGYEDTWFLFDLRVLESELARCELKVDSIDNDKRFRFTPKFDELVDAASFNYTIYDTLSDTFVLSNKKESGKTYTHTFDAGGQYEIQTSYYTPEGEKGSCLPEPLTVGYVGNKVEFDTRWRQDNTTPFVGAGEGTPVVVDGVNNEIIVNLLPAVLELSIEDVKPDPNAEVRLYYDGRQVFEDRDKVYEVNIGNLGTKELRFVIINNQGNEEEQVYSVDVSRQPVRAKIEVDPSVGEDPLEVVLDASISSLYDENDEIVYFTWDFGDGETRQNVSQGKITHVYKYDTENDNGEYYPSVTVKTKLGLTDSFKLPTPIIVKKRQRSVTIAVDSHPTRQAQVNDVVQFSVETDGQVSSIDRSFGDGQSLGCEGRACAQAPVRYSQPGEYDIRVEVQYANDVPVTSRTKVRVY